MLAITAFLGNVLIVVAFPKVSSLHPPSKILLGCLATTDLSVGIISQPIYFIFLSTENSKLCYYSVILSYTMGSIFCGVSLLTLTAISLDRLLALMLGLRYRQVVTLGRIWTLVAAFWLSSTVLATALLFNILVAKCILCISTFSCIMTSTFCNTKIALTKLQVQSHGSPRTTEWRRNSTEYSTIQKNSLRFFVGTDNVGGLLSSLFYRSYIRYN